MKRWKLVVVGALILGSAVGAGTAVAQRQRPAAPARIAAPVPSGSTRDLGAGITETKLVSITPCRIVDTRLAGGTIGNNKTRGFKVRGNGAPFAAQGGKANGCGIPAGATAIEATISAVDPVGSGFLRAYPSNKSEPTATFLNFDTDVDISNAGHLTICGGGCPDPNKDLTVKIYRNATHVVIDVTGYTVKPLAAVVRYDGILIRGSRVISSSKVGSLQSGRTDVRFDRDVSSCTYVASAGNDGGDSSIYVTAQLSENGNDRVRVNTRDATGSELFQSFNLVVIC